MNQPSKEPVVVPFDHLMDICNRVDSIVLDQAISLGRQRLAEAALKFALNPDVEGATTMHNLASAIDLLISVVAFYEDSIDTIPY